MRLALGATPAHVMRMVILDGLSPVAVGIVVGAGLVWLLGSALTAPLRNQVPTAHLLVLTAVPLLILAASTVACYVPGRRAARIDPASALKQ